VVFIAGAPFTKHGNSHSQGGGDELSGKLPSISLIPGTKVIGYVNGSEVTLLEATSDPSVLTFNRAKLVNDLDVNGKKLLNYTPPCISLIQRGYTTSKVVYYANELWLPRGTRIHASCRGSGSVALGCKANNLILSATETILKSGFDPTNAKDHDLNTYSLCQSAWGSVDLVKYDLGSVAERIILFDAEGSKSGTSVIIQILLYVSSDDVNYTMIAYADSPRVQAALKVTFRYIKVKQSVYSTAADGKLYGLEVYTPSAMPCELEVSQALGASNGLVLLNPDGVSLDYILYRIEDTG
jgi:hypothetical protein